MGNFSKERRQAFSDRRAERMAKQGILLEIEVERILSKMKLQGKISDFAHYPRNSEEDSDGRDFTVIKLVGAQTEERSFGVTISLQSWQLARIRHSDVPQFCFPIGTNPETIEKKISQLFE